jgi:hypothetical protein
VEVGKAGHLPAYRLDFSMEPADPRQYNYEDLYSQVPEPIDNYANYKDVPNYKDYYLQK